VLCRPRLVPITIEVDIENCIGIRAAIRFVGTNSEPVPTWCQRAGLAEVLLLLCFEVYDVLVFKAAKEPKPHGRIWIDRHRLDGFIPLNPSEFNRSEDPRVGHELAVLCDLPTHDRCPAIGNDLLGQVLN
jgi:hypothetical protein